MIDETILDSIDAALLLLPHAMSSSRARVMLYAIGLQESRFEHRRQLVGNPPRPAGPAKGFWQFERRGGCMGVIHHPASRYWMHRVCVMQDVPLQANALWNAIETNDLLAAAAARLLLFTDPRQLPELDDPRGAWNLYVRTWRPGRPHRRTWDDFHKEAVATCMQRMDS